MIDADGVSIRLATSADWPMMKTLLQSNDLPTEDIGRNDTAVFLLAVDDVNNVQGTIGLESYGDCGLLRSLAVIDSARGSGLGRRLLSALEQQAANAGHGELWLLTIDADGFFSRHGYEKAERRDAPSGIASSREFSELCPASACLMRKTLPAGLPAGDGSAQSL